MHAATVTTERLREWARTAKQPAHALWGKARSSAGGLPAHPVLAHMLDVAAVAFELMSRIPSSTVERLLRAWPDPETGRTSLAFLVALHDLGKVSPQFESKVDAFVPVLGELGFDVPHVVRETDHGTLGVHLVARALEGVDVNLRVAWRVARAVCAHHGSFPTDARADDRRFASIDVGGPAWERARQAILGELATVLRPRPPVVEPSDYAWYLLVAGLTTFADWVGSREVDFPYSPPLDDPAGYFEASRARARAALAAIGQLPRTAQAGRSFRELFGFEPSPLQHALETIGQGLDEPALIVVEAPMGEGKTEAALVLAKRAEERFGHDGLFVGLPTQATANQMFGRVRRYLESARRDAPTNLHLVHGEAAIHDGYRALLASGIYDPEGFGQVRAERWFAQSKRALLAAFGVGTVDQALLGVLRTRHAHLRLFGLAGKTLVLDEVHAYDAYTSELIERLVAWVGSVGATIVLLSATLPRARRDALVTAYGGSPVEVADYPRITVARREGTRAVGVRPRSASKTIAVEVIADLEAAIATAARAVGEGACVGLICNSVRRAQQAYRAASPLVTAERLLVHARFPRDARQAQEQVLEGKLGPRGARPAGMLVVGTQVLEQSLDVDFDLLITDVAPIDLVLQRAGRLHRHRRERPAAHREPKLVVVRPAGSVLDAPLREVAGVYEEYVMRRTLLTLEGRDVLRLPHDIDPLVAAVYDPEDTPELASLRADFERRRRAYRNDARTRELPSPHSRSDPFSDLGLPFEEDDPTIHESLRALTRLGDPSVDVVCLERTSTGLLAGGESVDLDATPSDAALSAMLRRTVGIAHRAIVRELLSAPPPRSWERTALLASKRPLVFEDGVARVGEHRITLDPELGIVIDRESE